MGIDWDSILIMELPSDSIEAQLWCYEPLLGGEAYYGHPQYLEDFKETVLDHRDDLTDIEQNDLARLPARVIVLPIVNSVRPLPIPLPFPNLNP